MTRKPMMRSGLTLMELAVVLLILVALAGLLVPMIATTTTDAQYTTTKATMKSLRDAIIAYNQDMKLPAAWANPTTGTTPPGTTGVPLTLKDLLELPVGANYYNPTKRCGWRGPYLLQATGKIPAQTNLNSSWLFPTINSISNPYGTPPGPGNPSNPPADPAFLDAWGNPIVLQWPQAQNGDPVGVYSQWVRLVSFGPPQLTSGSMEAQILTPYNTTGNPLAPSTNPIPYSYYAPTIASRGHNIVLFIFVQDPYQ